VFWVEGSLKNLKRGLSRSSPPWGVRAVQQLHPKKQRCKKKSLYKKEGGTRQRQSSPGVKRKARQGDADGVSGSAVERSFEEEGFTEALAI